MQKLKRLRIISYSLLACCVVIVIGTVIMYRRAHTVVNGVSQLDPHKIVKLESTDPNAIGNVMASYFYYVYAADRKTALEHPIDSHVLNNASDLELRDFFARLNWTQPTNAYNYLSSAEEAWNQLYSGQAKPNYLGFWQYVRPKMQELYTRSLPNLAVSQPVIHFRCSQRDSPFNKHAQYHLTKAASVEWMAQQLRARGYDSAILLSCGASRTANKNVCSQYTDLYISLFQQAGIQVASQCNSILHDFALMYRAPMLVALNASSFSFMAGVAKNPNDFISCNMGAELGGKYYLQTEADWILDSHKPLLHKNVLTYNSPTFVIPQLKL